MTSSDPDLYLDEDMFVTKLALQILEGRTFDNAGTKVQFEELFTNNDADADSESSSDTLPPQPETEEDDDFIARMSQNLEIEYQKLFVEETRRVEAFRTKSGPASKIWLPEYKKLIDQRCEEVLQSIEEMKNSFQDPAHLDRVTSRLEKFWEYGAEKDKKED